MERFLVTLANIFGTDRVPAGLRSHRSLSLRYPIPNGRLYLKLWTVPVGLQGLKVTSGSSSIGPDSPESRPRCDRNPLLLVIYIIKHPNDKSEIWEVRWENQLFEVSRKYIQLYFWLCCFHEKWWRMLRDWKIEGQLWARDDSLSFWINQIPEHVKDYRHGKIVFWWGRLSRSSYFEEHRETSFNGDQVRITRLAWRDRYKSMMMTIIHRITPRVQTWPMSALHGWGTICC